VSDESNKTEAEAVAELTQKPFVEEIKGVPHLLHPDGDGGWTYDALPELLPAPLRKTGSITIHEVDSFVDFAKKQGKEKHTNIYLDVDYVKQNIVATAVFNDNSEVEVAGWKDHKAVFTPRLGEEWKRWNVQHKQAMDQEKFANFLQDNVGDINNSGNEKLPSGSDVLTFVSNLQETRTVKYGSAVNLQNGMVQLNFVEDGDDATKGNLEVFKEFGLALRPFFGGEAYEVKALLRYRIERNSGHILFWFELQRPDRVLEDACKALIEKVKTETKFPVIFGTAP
jgi:uncharacterized protein YfdQ (DUF2303 family)